MQRWLMLGLVGIILTGCAQTLYVHPTKSVEDFYADKTACQATATTAGGFYDTYGLVAARVFPECMFGKGWRKQVNN